MHPFPIARLSSTQRVASQPAPTSRARLGACAGVLVALSIIPTLLAPTGAAHAQAKTAPNDVTAEPKQIPLTQQQVDGLVSAQKTIKALEAKVPEKDADKPNPKLDAAIADAVKKNGFDSVDAFSNASFSVGMVLAGMDSESKQYIGPAAVTKKQIAEVQADKTMSPKDKKDALDELAAAAKQPAADKPLDGNIALVSKNYDVLNTALQSDAE